MSEYYCDECKTGLEEMGHTNGGDYHEASYCCPGCGRTYQYDTRRNPHWSPSRPLIEDELSKVFPTEHCGFEKMCKAYSGYKPCRSDRCEFRCVSDSTITTPQQIILTPECPDCKEDPAWASDWLCKSDNPSTYQSCINNRKEGKCPRKIPLFGCINVVMAAQERGKQRTLDRIWEWLEVGVECEKPNPVISQLADKIIKMRDESLPIELPRGFEK